MRHHTQNSELPEELKKIKRIERDLKDRGTYTGSVHLRYSYMNYEQKHSFLGVCSLYFCSIEFFRNLMGHHGYKKHKTLY